MCAPSLSASSLSRSVRSSSWKEMTKPVGLAVAISLFSTAGATAGAGQWKTLHEQGLAALEKRDLDEAEKALRAAIDAVTERPSAEFAFSQRYLAAVIVRRGDLEGATRALEMALEELEAISPRDLKEIVTTHMMLVSMFTDIYQKQQSALKIVENPALLGADPQQIAEAKIIVESFQGNMTEPSEIEALLDRAEKSLGTEKLDNDEDEIVRQWALAQFKFKRSDVLLWDVSKLPAAQQQLVEALEHAVAGVGRDHEFCVSVMERLAFVQSMGNQIEDGLRFAKRAVEINNKLGNTAAAQMFAKEFSTTVLAWSAQEGSPISVTREQLIEHGLLDDEE